MMTKSGDMFPADAAVREAVEHLSACERYQGLANVTVDGESLRTILSFVRAAQSPRLTGERLEAVREAIEVLGYCEASTKLRAAFPELEEG